MEKTMMELPPFSVYDCASATYDNVPYAPICSMLLPSRYKVDLAGITNILHGNDASSLTSVIRYLNKQALGMSTGTVRLYFSLPEFMSWSSVMGMYNLHNQEIMQAAGDEGVISWVIDKYFDSIIVHPGIDSRVGESLAKFCKYKHISPEEVVEATGISRVIIDQIFVASGRVSPTTAVEDIVKLRKFMSKFPVDLKEFNQIKSHVWVPNIRGKNNNG